MNFERGGDIKETLKIGRKANALKLIAMEIKGEIAIPIIKGSLTNKLAVKYNFKGEAVALKIDVKFLLNDLALSETLEILSQDGICLRFDDYINHLILMRAPDEIKKYSDISFDHTSKNILTKTRWVLLRTKEDGDFFPRQLTFKETGRDILYQGQLYRIAPPKDGGPEDEL